MIEFTKLNDKILGQYKVKSYLVDHGKCKLPYGFTIDDGTRKLGISGDSIRCLAIDEIVQASDLSILDMSFFEANKNHMCFRDIAILIEKYKKPIIATHINDDVREQVQKLNLEGLTIPDDGYIFEI